MHFQRIEFIRKGVLVFFCVLGALSLTRVHAEGSEKESASAVSDQELSLVFLMMSLKMDMEDDVKVIFMPAMTALEGMGIDVKITGPNLDALRIEAVVDENFFATAVLNEAVEELINERGLDLDAAVERALEKVEDRVAELVDILRGHQKGNLGTQFKKLRELSKVLKDEGNEKLSQDYAGVVEALRDVLESSDLMISEVLKHESTLITRGRSKVESSKHLIPAAVSTRLKQLSL